MGAYSSKLLPPVTPYYRMRRYWLFWWQIQRTWKVDGTLREIPGRTCIKTYFNKDEATAHLVKLKLEGEDVEL